jgi:hypothetical protein
MNVIRTAFLLIIWVGYMAGAASSILDGNTSILFLFVAIIASWLALKVGTGIPDGEEKPARPPVCMDEQGNFWRDE